MKIEIEKIISYGCRDRKNKNYKINLAAESFEDRRKLMETYNNINYKKLPSFSNIKISVIEPQFDLDKHLQNVTINKLILNLFNNNPNNINHSSALSLVEHITRN